MNNSRVQTAACLFGSIVFLTFAINANFLQAAMPLQDVISTASMTGGSGPSIGVNPNPHAGPEDLVLGFLSFHTLIKGLMVASISIVGMNVASTGKKGWGWKTLALMVTVMLFIVKCIVMMFAEVTSSNPIADWDED